MKLDSDYPPNERPGVDAGWRVPFAFQGPWPRATQGERWRDEP